MVWSVETGQKALQRRLGFPLRTDSEDPAEGSPQKDDIVIREDFSHHGKKKKKKEMMLIVCFCLKRKLRRVTATLMDDKVMINCLAWEFCD